MTPRLATTTVIAILAGVLMHDWQGFVVVFTSTWCFLTQADHVLLKADRDQWRDLAELRRADAERQWAADLHATPHDTTVAEVLGSVTPIHDGLWLDRLRAEIDSWGGEPA